jgi:hypothetical protein
MALEIGDTVLIISRKFRGYGQRGAVIDILPYALFNIVVRLPDDSLVKIPYIYVLKGV